jgi:lipocalin
LRYQGKWYEIFRYDTLIYEKDCTTATADYLWEDNTLYITNTCYTNGVKVRESYGQARVPDSNDSGKLLVKFTESPVEAPYWVHWTDYDNYAIVGGQSDKFLWILSRTPTITEDVFWKIVKSVKIFGYDPKSMVFNTSSVVFNTSSVV